jgi:hypothetical protein
LNPCLHLESVIRVDFSDLRRRGKKAADLRMQFFVVSRRHPSIFNVMLDRYGITRRVGVATPFT